MKFRAWHRGFREADLILGPFADSHAHTLPPAQLEAFERLLDDESDHDIYGWIVGREAAPDHIDPELMAMLQAFDPASRGAHGA